MKRRDDFTQQRQVLTVVLIAGDVGGQTPFFLFPAGDGDARDSDRQRFADAGRRFDYSDACPPGKVFATSANHLLGDAD